MTMGPELSRRLGRALGTKTVPLDEQATVRDATRTAEVWEDLSPEVQALVEQIESQPDTWAEP